MSGALTSAAPVTGAVVSLDHVCKRYDTGAISVDALVDVTLEIDTGSYVAVMGPSGCGKSTLMNIIGCLDRPTRGQYRIGGTDVAGLDDDSLSRLRGSHLGFVFQSYNLIQQLTVLENVELPLFYQGRAEHESRAIATHYAELVGLEDRLHHRPFELSGGQQQRVGIARALVNNPLVLLADEPTGNLDSKSGADIMAIFDDLNAQGRTVITVTHSSELAERASHVVHMLDGRVERHERQ